MSFRLDIVEDKISELEDKTKEVSQNKTQQDTEVENMKKKL